MAATLAEKSKQVADAVQALHGQVADGQTIAVGPRGHVPAAVAAATVDRDDLVAPAASAEERGRAIQRFPHDVLAVEDRHHDREFGWSTDLIDVLAMLRVIAMIARVQIALQGHSTARNGLDGR